TTGATTPTFATNVDFPTGSSPVSVSIGDFNGDGKPDLAVANFGSAIASILLNTTATGATTPTFATNVDFPTGNSPRSVSIGDINGDGKPDLAVANNSSNNASILLNTTPTGATTPTFATNVDFPTGSASNSVSIGDFNGDGKPDLAVANFGNSTASILLNTTPKVTAVTATTADGSYKAGDTIAITVTFNAAVNVTGTPQLQLETGTTDQFANYTSGSGSTTLTFNYVVQAGDTSADLEYLTTNSLTLNGGTIKDNLAVDAILTLPALADANSLGGNKAIIIDGVAPTITSITSTTTDGSYNTTGNINVTVNFSEAVTLAGGNMSVALDTGGTVTIAPFTGTSAVGTYTPAAGQNSTDLNSTTITLATGATLRDAAANNATLTIPAGQSLADNKAIVVDTIVPTVALTSTSPTTTNAPFLVTATFSESVTGFIASDVTVANGTVSGFTGSGTTAGNNNTAAAQLTRTADITAPTVALTSTSPTTTNAPFLVTATFSESVTGFIASDVTVANGAVSGFTGSGTTYNFTVTPTATGNVTVDVPAATATDTAGNNNTAATQLVRTADITAPTVALTSTSPTTTNAPFLVTATFSESVTGFIASDVTVANGTVSGFTGSGT
ncbi:MAG: VCBS repeat-containing protein, partial [Microcoleus sp. PH2017_29_MFU_D_A]|uniref:beta strand repeat-containing protein n=1 Tax=Microcoleus sp. PH2017_29_MFU_D_A TaxID=2798839 RepID=UPI001DCB115C